MGRFNSLIALSIVICLAATCGIAFFCGSVSGEDGVMVFEGKVVSVDRGKSVLTVAGTSTMSFPIKGDTEIRKDIYDIELSDIAVGDYVNVEYSADKTGGIEVSAITVEYGKS